MPESDATCLPLTLAHGVVSRGWEAGRGLG